MVPDFLEPLVPANRDNLDATTEEGNEMRANKTYTTPQDASAQQAATQLWIDFLPEKRLVFSTFSSEAWENNN